MKQKKGKINFPLLYRSNGPESNQLGSAYETDEIPYLPPAIYKKTLRLYVLLRTF